MACGPCRQTRQAFVTAARSFDIRGATQAVRTAAQINIDKLRGVNVEEKYGGTRQPNKVAATPYRRRT